MLPDFETKRSGAAALARPAPGAEVVGFGTLQGSPAGERP
jgi:hypothetical protein